MKEGDFGHSRCKITPLIYLFLSIYFFNKMIIPYGFEFYFVFHDVNVLLRCLVLCRHFLASGCVVLLQRFVFVVLLQHFICEQTIQKGKLCIFDRTDTTNQIMVVSILQNFSQVFSHYSIIKL